METANIHFAVHYRNGKDQAVFSISEDDMAVVSTEELRTDIGGKKSHVVEGTPLRVAGGGGSSSGSGTGAGGGSGGRGGGDGGVLWVAGVSAAAAAAVAVTGGVQLVGTVPLP
jgi:hypothetical protein